MAWAAKDFDFKYEPLHAGHINREQIAFESVFPSRIEDLRLTSSEPWHSARDSLDSSPVSVRLWLSRLHSFGNLGGTNSCGGSAAAGAVKALATAGAVEALTAAGEAAGALV